MTLTTDPGCCGLDVFGPGDAVVQVGSTGTRGTAEQLRYRIAPVGDGGEIVACWQHRQTALNRCPTGHFCVPTFDPVDCDLCVEGAPAETHERDEHGFFCGQDFMGGTICSGEPHHDGGCVTICRTCDGDWLAGSCTCANDEDDDD